MAYWLCGDMGGENIIGISLEYPESMLIDGILVVCVVIRGMRLTDMCAGPCDAFTSLCQDALRSGIYMNKIIRDM